MKIIARIDHVSIKFNLITSKSTQKKSKLLIAIPFYFQNSSERGMNAHRCKTELTTVIFNKLNFAIHRSAFDKCQL